jgi:hypothetical protein
MQLQAAVATLEHPSLVARLGEIAGKPIELLGRALPETASKAIGAATTKALNAALAVAHYAERAQGCIRPTAQGTGSHVGCGGRQFWFDCTTDRASDLDHHHAAIDWGRGAQRG